MDLFAMLHFGDSFTPLESNLQFVTAHDKTGLMVQFFFNISVELLTESTAKGLRDIFVAFDTLPYNASSTTRESNGTRFVLGPHLYHIIKVIVLADDVRGIKLFERRALSSLEGVIDVEGRAKKEQNESEEEERSDTDDDETLPLSRSLSVPASMESQPFFCSRDDRSGQGTDAMNPHPLLSNEEVNELFIEDNNLEGIIGKARRKTMGNRISVALETGRRVVTAVVEEMERK
ncbi:hypothetical protein BJ742DRAFT_738670 [Cladochytrium replicatum]|nr:hypothetical protein BJ742DRAFT_738670 [Cladochytrium replicatum]